MWLVQHGFLENKKRTDLANSALTAKQSRIGQIRTFFICERTLKEVLPVNLRFLADRSPAT